MERLLLMSTVLLSPVIEKKSVSSTETLGTYRFSNLILLIIMIELMVLILAMIIVIVRQGDCFSKISSKIADLEKKIELTMRNSKLTTTSFCSKKNKNSKLKLDSQKPEEANLKFTKQKTSSSQLSLNEQQESNARLLNHNPPKKLADSLEKQHLEMQDKVNNCNEKSVSIKCGLNVNDAIHYNSNALVKFDEKGLDDAHFILYSDMTVQPSKSSFRGYNTESYYYGHNFNVVYDFYDNANNIVVQHKTLKLLEVKRPAIVEKAQSGYGYHLVEKGILIVEGK